MADFFEQERRKFFEKTEAIDPLTAMVLKVHLLIEEQLNLALEENLRNHKHLPRLNFAGKLSLLRALTDYKSNDPSWQEIKLLNDLRNEVAHHLSSDKRSKIVGKILDKIVEAFESMEPRDIELIKDLKDIVREGDFENAFEDPGQIALISGSGCNRFLVEMRDELKASRGSKLQA